MEMTYVLPLNVTNQQKVALMISPPKSFICAQPQLEAFINGQTDFVEYIPKGESFDNWSKIITVNRYINKRLPAPYIVSTMVQKMSAQSKSYRVLAALSNDRGDHLDASFTMIYVLPNGQAEMIFAQYFSGPYDTAGFQVTIKIDASKLTPTFFDPQSKSTWNAYVQSQFNVIKGIISTTVKVTGSVASR